MSIHFIDKSPGSFIFNIHPLFNFLPCIISLCNERAFSSSGFVYNIKKDCPTAAFSRENDIWKSFQSLLRWLNITFLNCSWIDFYVNSMWSFDFKFYFCLLILKSSFLHSILGSNPFESSHGKSCCYLVSQGIFFNHI